MSKIQLDAWVRTMPGGGQIAISAAQDGMLTYRYALSMSDAQSDEFCVFHTYNEIGAPYQPFFDEMIEQCKLQIERGRNIPHKPWVADFLIRKELQHVDR